MQFSPVQSVKHSQGSVQELPERRICDHRQHCLRRRTSQSHVPVPAADTRSSALVKHFPLWVGAVPEVPQQSQLLPGRVCQDSEIGPSFTLASQTASMRDRLLTQVRTLKNPSISFWNESARARLRKMVHFDALWSYGELDLVLTPAPNLFRKLGQHAKRNMSFISPFITHSFTRNSRNESTVGKCHLCTHQSVSIWTDVLPFLSPSKHILAWLN